MGKMPMMPAEPAAKSRMSNFGGKAAKPFGKPEMVANRVVGMVKAGKPVSAEPSDPSMIKPGHHFYK